MTVLTEYLTNAALLKTFAWLEAVNLFLPAPVQVQFHQSMCPGCIVTFLQRTHVILDYFPSAPDLDLFGFGKINIETFLFFFFPQQKSDELILDILFWDWLAAPGLDASWRLTDVSKVNTWGCCFIPQASQVSKWPQRAPVAVLTHRHGDKRFRLDIFTFIIVEMYFISLVLNTQVWPTIF